MGLLRISGVRIGGLVTVVPKNEVSLSDEAYLFDNNHAQIDRLKATIGLDKRRVAPPGMTANDMAEAAVRKLLEETETDPESIDGIFMVTQTPDYLQPGNAVLLQGRIGLPTTCAAMDFNLGCSGYVYGLWAAHSFIAGGGLKRVILVVGDTISQIVSKDDRALRPLFGDAACATLLEADPSAPEALFDLQSDGTGYESLWQPGGAFREPWSVESAEVKTLGEGIQRSRCNLHMDGAEIFNFSLKVEPKAISDMFAATAWEPESVEGVVFHQANRYIIDNIRRRLKLPPEQVPSGTVERFGNQSSASIPATLTDHYGDKLTKASHRFFLSGFGVGLSWATCAVELPPLACNSLLEI
ncbi:ketoacyl-ACP synthase III [Puniceicoccales bacterium CK1056]|uniref:Ketoacyl-ACP synthase III n=1 Tax=Oceanipulchritudo coccoides TaxID=2706888 RepID=A0A6B2LZX3_9BACT|nr:ketoacyl-ACP synthase III [Oceanipulchritudo coccoides]NDV61626.1 ketoacyl-ACP synthase III [Oceanipulchritudo coccoides]